MIEVDQIKSDEGFAAYAYQCTEGYQTIGYGFNVDVGISEEEAAALVVIKCGQLIDALGHRLDWYNDAHEEVRAVLLNMAYQLGVAGLMKFVRTLAHLKNQEYKLAAIEMLDSKWAGQTKERAVRLSERIASL